MGGSSIARPATSNRHPTPLPAHPPRENAPLFGALLVFAEHRYYGASQPLGEDSLERDPSFFSAEQAMADYARLVGGGGWAGGRVRGA